MFRRMALVSCLFLTVALVPSTVSAADPGSWQQLRNVQDPDPGIMFLLTDGTVLVQDQGFENSGSGDWWLLTPDSKGNYLNGTWSQTGSMPDGYKPLYAASGVLPDGRVVVIGGEFNGASTWAGENLGAIYDPIAKTWSALAPPNNGKGKFASVADAPSVVLANGQFMFGPSGNGDSGALHQTQQAILNPTDLSWTVTGQGMTGANPEAGFTLLQNGKVLMVDTPTNSGNNAEIFDPATGAWSSAGKTPSSLLDPSTAGSTSIAEIGPAIGMLNGKVFAEGSSQHTSIFDPGTNSWTAGPDFPDYNGFQMRADDASSAILQNGNVLFATSPVKNGEISTPTAFYTFDGTNIQPIDPPTDQTRIQSNFPYFLALPNGQILVDERVGPQTMFLYSSSGQADNAWLPQIETVPSNLTVATTYSLTGKQLSGLAQGSFFGDDWNNQTNYPLIKITNQQSGSVVYARTFNATSTSIAPGAESTVKFTLPTNATDGPSNLQVVASGFTSAATKVTIAGGVSLPAPTPKRTIVRPKPRAGAKKMITCVKGKVTKKILSANSKCPVGYKLKNGL